VIGFDYATLMGVTQSDCQSACQRDPSCRATTYSKRERFCFLKTDAKLHVRNEDAYANAASELSSIVAVSTFTIATGKDMVRRLQADPRQRFHQLLPGLRDR
jgi:serine protease Do